MDLIKNLKLIDSKFSWSFLGFVFAIIFGVIGVYTTVFYDKTTSIVYQITNNTNVLDIRERINKLDILLDGKSIQSTNQNLRIFNIKVLNNGDINILKNYYDSASPLGIKIANGEIVDQPYIVSASNDYLKNTVQLIRKNNDQLLFNEFILDKSEYFVIKLLVLHKESVDPVVYPIGKIAGIEKINVENVYDEKKQKGFWESVYEGNIWINIFRVVAYPITFILIIMIIVLPMIFISEKKDRFTRKRIVNKYKDVNDIKDNKDNLFLFNTLIEDGKTDLLIIEKILDESDDLVPKLKQLLDNPKDENEYDIRMRRELTHYESADRLVTSDEYFSKVLQKLIGVGYIVFEKDTWSIPKASLLTFQDFMKYLRAVGFIKRDDRVILRSDYDYARNKMLHNKQINRTP